MRRAIRQVHPKTSICLLVASPPPRCRTENVDSFISNRRQGTRRANPVLLGGKRIRQPAVSIAPQAPMARARRNRARARGKRTEFDSTTSSEGHATGEADRRSSASTGAATAEQQRSNIAHRNRALRLRTLPPTRQVRHDRNTRPETDELSRYHGTR